jgi:hypothetical protein
MKLTFGIIVLNGDFFLKQLLESIYPVAHAICIAEGAVSYHSNKFPSGSTDDTVNIIKSFPDPQRKIKYTTGKIYAEKTEQCRAWFDMVPWDTDYIICNDADEIHTPENLETLIEFLEREKPTSVGFKSDSFYGGFKRIIGGFERDHSFKRVLRYYPNAVYRTHRQPTLAWDIPSDPDSDEYDIGRIAGLHITGNQLWDDTGITMWHGSYVSPGAVKEKIEYYENAVIAPGKCIPNYFDEVYLPWVLGDDYKKVEIEEKYNGVQEFIPEARGECKTMPYGRQHPEVIRKYWSELHGKFVEQLAQITGKIIFPESFFPQDGEYEMIYK